METSLIEKFVEKITEDKKEHTDRFFKIFSARGFLLELDKTSGNVRLSDDSHREDCEFLEILQNSNYKKICHKPHLDSIHKRTRKDSAHDRHRYLEHIDTQLFDINSNQYLAEIFTHEIPVDIFRLNWERAWYGKFEQFKNFEDIPKVRVYDLEPFIARLVKSVSSLGISTWSSCEGHWGEPAYIKFDGKYHRIWCQAIFNKFVKKKLNLVCNWEWWGWDERCSISSPGGDVLKLYLEIQDVARLLYDSRISLRNAKRQACSLLGKKHEGMNKKELLTVFEGYCEEFCS